MNLGLEGQITLITGSSRGIGKGIAETFLQEEAVVILTGRDRAALTAVQESFSRIYGASRVHAWAGDLLQGRAVEDLYEFIDKEFGRLNQLICNLGAGKSVPPLEEDAAEWQRMLDINLLSAAACVRGLLPLLKPQAEADKGMNSIIFIASICGVEVLGCPVAYAAAKNALIAYARNIARPLGRMGIRVNAISPGNIIFPGSTWEAKLAHNREAVQAMLNHEVPMQRFGAPEEIGSVAAFLASRRAGFVTGANWVVDGGQTRNG